MLTFMSCTEGLNIKSPDYTTVSKRGKTLGLSMILIERDEEFDYVSIDSTGIQTFTGNEWVLSQL